MQSIKDLLSTSAGRQFLETQRITTQLETFVAQLTAPDNPILGEYLGTGCDKLVYAFQQIYIDITQSMIDRIHLLDDLTRYGRVAPFFLWIDTDRAGSDKITTRIYWPHWGKVQSIPICPNAVKDIETRFVKVNPLQLEKAIDKLGMYLVQSVTGRRARTTAEHRYQKLRELFLENHIKTLSEFNYRISSFLLGEFTGMAPAAVFVSDLVEGGMLTSEVETALNQMEGIVQAFNQAREDLIRQDIDPVVKALAENYLPLNYSCPVCQRRLRLARENIQGEQFAVAACRCGETYRFHLGGRRLSLDTLIQTGRWSPDVSLALLMNGLVSGFIGGTSSGVYFGLLMKAALEQVLGVYRVPVLLPEIRIDSQNNIRAGTQETFDSLIYRYLTEAQVQVMVPEIV